MNHREFERSRIPVADTDSDYARERQEKKNIAEQEDRYFGKEFFDEHDEYNGKPLDAIPELFEGLWKKQSGLGLSILTGFSKEMLYHPKMRNTPAVQNAVRGMPSAPFAPQELLRAILMCEIPPDVMVDMLRIHRQTHEAYTIYVNERLPDMRQRFLKGVSRLLRAPQHPLLVEILPYGTVERRMSEVAVVAGGTSLNICVATMVWLIIILPITALHCFRISRVRIFPMKRICLNHFPMRCFTRLPARL